ncbi:MAG: hypothetical protein A4E63_00538 [Syntrophorhabdus sp. PtaU1.Bin050]|nr:MAG: hypothetical protein A4E63_00538 [Syntrophorhabdus sp. PtaU1.Bin050]
MSFAVLCTDRGLLGRKGMSVGNYLHLVLCAVGEYPLVVVSRRSVLPGISCKIDR